MAITISRTATPSTDANSSLFNFGTQSLGAEVPSRFVAVAISLLTISGGISITSVTVGGVTCTHLASAIIGQHICSLWASPRVSEGGPTGTTGNVTINLNGTGLNCYIDVYNVSGALSIVPYDTLIDTAAPLTGGLDVPDFSGAIGIARATGTPGNSTWTGLIEDSDRANEAVTITSTAAHNTFTSAQTVTVGITTAAGTPLHLVAASWEPVPPHVGESTFNGVGNLLANVTRQTHVARATLPGVGALSARLSKTISATFAGVGNFTAMHSRHYLHPARFNGVSGLSVYALQNQTMTQTVHFAGAGAMRVPAEQFLAGVLQAGSAAITGAMARQWRGVFNWSGEATMEFVGTTTFINSVETETELAFSTQIHLRSL